MASYGIRGNVLNWVSDFHNARTQTVKVNSSFSDPLPVSSGIPQGSVLGPLLYFIYSNDVVDLLNNCFVKIFATTVNFIWWLKLHNHIAFVEDISKIFGWYDANQLNIALENCMMLQLGRYNPHRENTINTTKLISVDSIRI